MKNPAQFSVEINSGRLSMKHWFDRATFVENASVEIGFLLHPVFYYGPARYPQSLAEPISRPTFARAAKHLATTKEAEDHVDELSRYYADIVHFSRKHDMSFQQFRHYFWLQLFICDPSGKFYVSFPCYDTLSEMEGLLHALVRPPSRGAVHWGRDQGWEVEIDAHDDMLYVREWDPDYGENDMVVKLPLLSLASSSKTALDRARRVIAALAAVLTEDAWTTHQKKMNFSKLILPMQAKTRAGTKRVFQHGHPRKSK
jgi:hypothetical protein